MRKKGFTLIELLVVIAIIGLLATISIISLNSARAKGRDARRLADVDQITTAVELFNNSMGYYPDPCPWSSNSCTIDSKSDDGYWDSFQSTLFAYLKNGKLPRDPSNTTARPYSIFASKQNGTLFGLQIVYSLENSNPNMSNAAFASSWSSEGIQYYSSYIFK